MPLFIMVGAYGVMGHSEIAPLMSLSFLIYQYFYYIVNKNMKSYNVRVPI